MRHVVGDGREMTDPVYGVSVPTRPTHPVGGDGIAGFLASTGWGVLYLLTPCEVVSVEFA